MTMLHGILELPNGTEGRLRQLGDRIIESNDDPFVPLSLTEQYPLRPGQALCVEVVERRSRRRRRRGKGQGGANRNVRPVVEKVLEIEGLDPEAYAGAQDL
jgi:hypothetical protein